MSTKMSLGSYTFERNPTIDQSTPLVVKKRHWAAVQTYSSVAFFSWGLDYAGSEISLPWSTCTNAQFLALNSLFEADAVVIFDPNDGRGKTFQVQITDLVGEFMLRLNGDNPWRKNVRMDLLIIGEI